MAQDLLKSEGQTTKEAVTYSDMKARSLRLECAYVENEIKHLLQPSSSSSQTTSDDQESTGIHSKTPELLTARTQFSSEIDRGTSSGDQHNGCSPIRSILKAAQDFFDNVNGHGCSAAQDGLESPELHNCESRHGRGHYHKVDEHGCMEAQLESRELHKEESRSCRDHHKVTVKERCTRARFQVPPLDFSGSTGFENHSSLAQDPNHFGHRGDELEMREHDDEQVPRNKDRKEKKHRVGGDAISRGNLSLSQRDVEREEITQCQTEIMKTLQGLKANMGYLLDLEERSNFKVPQRVKGLMGDFVPSV